MPPVAEVSRFLGVLAFVAGAGAVALFALRSHPATAALRAHATWAAAAVARTRPTRSADRMQDRAVWYHMASRGWGLSRGDGAPIKRSLHPVTQRTPPPPIMTP